MLRRVDSAKVALIILGVFSIAMGGCGRTQPMGGTRTDAGFDGWVPQDAGTIDRGKDFYDPPPDYRWIDGTDRDTWWPDYGQRDHGRSDARWPDFGIPDYRGPDFGIADYRGPDFSIPDFRWPDFRWPDFRWPDAGPPDAWPTDGPIPPDIGNDLPPGCDPSCAEICKTADSCGLISYGQCLFQCSAASADDLRCIKAAYCTNPWPPCTAMKNCGQTPPPPPPPLGSDLYISSFTTFVGGSSIPSVTYRLRICNGGRAPSARTSVHVYYNRSTPPRAGEDGEQVSSLPALKPGSCTNRSLTRRGVPVGTYRSWAQVDPHNQVQELNESNNAAGPQVLTVGSNEGADLTIASFTANLRGANAIRYLLRVCNVGKGRAGSSMVHVYYHRRSAPQPGEGGDQAANVSQLPPGRCTTVVLLRSGVPTGSYTSWAQVDPLDQIKETDNRNNTAGPAPISVDPEADRANLRIRQFAAKAAGSTVYYTLVVCNDGRASAGQAEVDIYYDLPRAPRTFQRGNRVIYTSPLSPGACQTLNATQTNTPDGSYNSWAQVDRRGLIPETRDGHDNLAGPRQVRVGQPPLSCTGVCTAAISCGIFPPVQLSSCLDWCASLQDTQKTCVSNAARENDCVGLKRCAPLPPPPPPPPPGACDSFCAWFSSCKLLPGGIGGACGSLCSNLAPDRLRCAQGAQKASQCLQAVLCIL